MRSGARRIVWRGIVRATRFSERGRKLVHITSEDKSVECVLPIGPMAGWFKRDEGRAYAEATLDDRGILNIVRKVRGRQPAW